MDKTKIIDSQLIAKAIKLKLTQNVALIKRNFNIVPQLAIILVGNDRSSRLYIKNKISTAGKIGINTKLIELNETVSLNEVLQTIDNLNQNPEISGIIVQLPLPKQIDKWKIFQAINPEKDVDGFHPMNISYAYNGLDDGFIPCTALGCLTLIKSCIKNIAGKHAVIVGRSNIVGKPLIALLLQHNLTITICHSITTNLKQITSQADIVITAIGQADYFDESYFASGAVVIDVGINWKENNKLVGDVQFDKVLNKISYITPVPGGVGPMTIAYLLKNTTQAMIRQNNLPKNYEI